MGQTIEWGFPFKITSGGLVEGASSSAHLEQLILQVLFTNPGERVMRPTFGAGVGQLVFESMSAEQINAVQSIIQAQLQQSMYAKIIVQSVTAVALTSDQATLQITIQYTPHGSTASARMQVNV